MIDIVTNPENIVKHHNITEIHISTHSPLYARIMGYCVLIIVTQLHIDLHMNLNIVMLYLCDYVMIIMPRDCALIV